MRRIKTIYSILIISLIILGWGTDLEGQGWKRYYHQNTESRGYAMFQTPDQGYMMFGRLGYSTLKEMMILKTDLSGKEIWKKDYPYILYPDVQASVLQLADGDFMLIASNPDTTSIALLRIDQMGDIVWSQEYDGNGEYYEAISIAETQDGGFLLLGASNFNGEYGNFLIKTDENGSLIWDQTLPQFEDVKFKSMTTLDNGAIFFAGSYQLNFSSRSYLAKLLKMNSNGELLWERSYPTYDYEYSSEMTATSDGNLVFVSNNSALAHTQTTNLVKLDTAGNVLWEKIYDGFVISEANKVIETSDQGFLILGTELDTLEVSSLPIPERDDESADAFILKTDSEGNELWTKTYNFFDNGDEATVAIETLDNGFAITGGMKYNGLAWSARDNLFLIKTDSLGNVYSNYIIGKVFDDDNESCSFNDLEIGLQNWVVKAESEEETFYAFSDAIGDYYMEVDTGTYEVSIAPYAYWEPCEVSYEVQFSNFYDTTSLDIPLQASEDCPYMEVHIATPMLRLCRPSYYVVAYCNYGSEAALGATVEVMLPDSLIYIDATAPLLSQNNSVYTFDIGDVDIGECGDFTINVQVPCNIDFLGQTFCAEALIFPDSICDSGLWDGPIIEASGECTSIGDSVVFTLKNVGMDMQTPFEYIVIEDNIILLRGTYQLAFGEEKRVVVPAAPDATYHILTGQGLGFPSPFGNPVASATVEACVGSPNPIWYSQIPEDDGEPYLSVFCKPIIAAYDPNDKKAFPAGWTSTHYIDEFTSLEYHIRFQNTGTDTAFHVMILDTLSALLDPATIQIGAASHSYEFEFLADDVVQFSFPNIMLPDSNVNEVASHGFVSFNINQNPNNIIGDLITNDAAIYFDFNPPVITNETYHTVGIPWVQLFPVVTRDITSFGEVKVYPNPLQNTALIEIPDFTARNRGHFILYNLQGQIVQEKYFQEKRFSLEGEHLPAGIYGYEIRLDGQSYSAGKVVVVK